MTTFQTTASQTTASTDAALPAAPKKLLDIPDTGKPIRVTLEEKRGRSSPQDYYIAVNGTRWGEVYYNLRGYCGYIPTSSETALLDVGEKGVSVYKREISRVNAEFKKQTGEQRAASLDLLRRTPGV